MNADTTDQQSQSIELFVSSGLHLTSPSKRLNEIQNAIDSLDVIFIEAVDHEPPSVEIRLLNWIAFPLGLLAIRIYLVLLSAIGRLTGFSDRELIERISETYDANVIPVEKHYQRHLAEDRLFWGIGHWGVTLIAFAGTPGWMAGTSAQFEALANLLIATIPSYSALVIISVLLVQIALWYLFAGLIMSAFFIAGTLQSRNEIMVSSMEEYVDRYSPENGCLVIGGRHRTDIEELIEGSELVTLSE